MIVPSVLDTFASIAAMSPRSIMAYPSRSQVSSSADRSISPPLPFPARRGQVTEFSDAHLNLRRHLVTTSYICGKVS
jgi:hypothetical protein